MAAGNPQADPTVEINTSTGVVHVRNSDGDTILITDQTNSRVGIGTATPGQPLDVVGNIRATGSLCNSSGGYFTSGTIYSPYDLNIKLYTGSTTLTRMFIDRETGYVGVGTTSPEAPLHTYSTDSSQLILERNGNDEDWGAGLWFRLKNDSSVPVTYAGIYGCINDPTPEAEKGDIRFYVSDPDFTEKMRLSWEGKLGIGITSDPLAPLHIKDGAGAGVSLTGTHGLIVETDEASSDSDYLIRAATPTYSNLMALTTSGKLGIGKTPAFTLDVNGPIVTTGSYLRGGLAIVNGITGLYYNSSAKGAYSFGSETAGEAHPILISSGDATRTDGYISLSVAGDEALRATADSQIGIGTSNPSANLTVYSTSTSNLDRFRIEGSSGTLFDVQDDLTGELFGVTDISGIALFSVHSTNGVILYDNTLLTNGILTVSHEASYSYPNPGDSATGAINIQMDTSGYSSGITFSGAGTEDAQGGLYAFQSDLSGLSLHLATTDNYTTGPQSRLTVHYDGTVSIGSTTKPTEKLHVTGDIAATGTIKAATDVEVDGTSVALDGHNHDESMSIVLYPEFSGAVPDAGDGTLSLETSIVEDVYTNYYKWTGGTEGADQNIYVMLTLPGNLHSLTSISMYYKTDEAATTNNSVEIEVYENGVATAIVDSGTLASTSWTTYTNNGAGLSAFAAGDVMVIKCSLVSAGAAYEAFLGKLTIAYTQRIS